MTLLRELAVSFYGVELAYVLALGVWLLATAAGALIPVWTRGRPWIPSLVLLLCGLVIPLSATFVRGSRLLFGGVPGAYLEFDRQMAVMALGLAPSAMVSGWLFRSAAGKRAERGGTLAGAYGMESAGGLFGGLLPAVGLALGIQNFVLACAAPALALIPLACFDRLRWRQIGAGVLAACSIAAGLVFDEPTTRWNHPDLVEAHDSPYGRLAVVSHGSALAVFQNDALWFESEGVEAETFVHVAAVQAEPLSRVLVLGGGASGLVAEALAHDPERIDWVEVDPSVARVIGPRLPSRLRDPLGDERVKPAIADPRHFLREAGVYDLVLVGSAEPISGEANRLYTREFFVEASNHLAPSGVLAFRLSSGEYYWTPAAAARARSIHDAAREAFADVLVLPGSPNVFLAGKSRLSRDGGMLAERMAARRVTPRLAGEAYFRYVYDARRLAEVAARLEEVEAPQNTDGRPISYQYAAILWLSQFYPRLAAVDVAAVERWLARPLLWSLAIAAIAAIVLRRVRAVRWVLFAALAGFSGMVVETVLLLHYQMKNGVVFQDIGLLLTGVMAGLAAGAFLVDRAASRLERRPGARLAWGAGTCLLLAAVAALTAWLVAAGRGTGLAVTLALLAAAGMSVSMSFGYAGVRHRGAARAAAGRLYAADLAGAAAATLVATFALVPLAGLGASAGWMVALAAIAALLL